MTEGDDGWNEGSCNGKTGWYPANCKAFWRWENWLCDLVMFFFTLGGGGGTKKTWVDQYDNLKIGWFWPDTTSFYSLALLHLILRESYHYPFSDVEEQKSKANDNRKTMAFDVGGVYFYSLVLKKTDIFLIHTSLKVKLGLHWTFHVFLYYIICIWYDILLYDIVYYGKFFYR